MCNSICRALMAKLDKHGDKYQEAMIPAQWDVCNISIRKRNIRKEKRKNIVEY